MVFGQEVIRSPETNASKESDLVGNSYFQTSPDIYCRIMFEYSTKNYFNEVFN